MVRCLLLLLVATALVGCGNEENRVLTPQPVPQKSDADLTAEMMQGTLDVEKEMEKQAP